MTRQNFEYGRLRQPPHPIETFKEAHSNILGYRYVEQSKDRDLIQDVADGYDIFEPMIELFFRTTRKRGPPSTQRIHVLGFVESVESLRLMLGGKRRAKGYGVGEVDSGSDVGECGGVLDSSGGA